MPSSVCTRSSSGAFKTQCLLPCAETACMLFWALLASGQISLRRVDGRDTFHVPPNSTLIAPPERTNIANGRCAVSLSYHLRNTTRSCIKVGSGQVSKRRFGADRVGLIQIGTLSECHFSLA